MPAESAAARGDATFSSAMAEARGYKRWLLEIFRGYVGDSVLEVGVGDGGFRPLLPAGSRYVGLDIDAELLERVAAAHPGGRYVRADIQDPGLAAAVGGEGFDTVLCFNVLEHVEDDAGAVRNLLSLLRPGGHLLLILPAHDALYNDLDRLAGHLRRYTLTRVRQLVPSGCETPRLGYVNPVGALGWWANRFRRHDSLEDRGVRWQVILFDRLALPLSRALTPLTRRLFGQSVAAVVEAP